MYPHGCLYVEPQPLLLRRDKWPEILKFKKKKKKNTHNSKTITEILQFSNFEIKQSFLKTVE